MPTASPARSMKTSIAMLPSRRKNARTGLRTRRYGCEKRMSRVSLRGTLEPSEAAGGGLVSRLLTAVSVRAGVGALAMPGQAAERRKCRLSLATHRDHAGLPAVLHAAVVAQEEPDQHVDLRALPHHRDRLGEVLRLLRVRDAVDGVGRLRLVPVLGDPEVLAR